MTEARESTATYSERLWPGAGAWSCVPLAALGCALVLLPFGVVAGVVGAVIGFVLVTAGLVLASPRVEVSDGRLRAGRARIELELLGEPEAYLGEDARLQRGPSLDARAYLLLRGWVGPVVRIPVLDDADPTPYWLISTRQPLRLMSALRQSS